jgi:hypothetical protein
METLGWVFGWASSLELSQPIPLLLLWALGLGMGLLVSHMFGCCLRGNWERGAGTSAARAQPRGAACDAWPCCFLPPQLPRPRGLSTSASLVLSSTGLRNFLVATHGFFILRWVAVPYGGYGDALEKGAEKCERPQESSPTLRTCGTAFRHNNPYRGLGASKRRALL